jgi:PAS domain S-box-containing protein
MKSPRQTEPADEADHFSPGRATPARSLDQATYPLYRLRYQELFDFARVPQLVTDLRGVISEVNHAMAALFGISREFLIGKPLGLLISPESRRRFYHSLVNLRGGGSDRFEALITARTKRKATMVQAVALEESPPADGSIRWQLEDVSYRGDDQRLQRELMRRIVTSQEEERRRISREIHDQFGQELTALTFGLKELESYVADGTAGWHRLRALKQIVDRLSRQAHDLAAELRPAALDDLGLRAAIEGLVQRWSDEAGLSVGLHFLNDVENSLGSEVESTLYRVIQEGLTNIAKHADASSVSVIVEKQGAHAIAIIEDDGRGFDPETQRTTPGLGLMGMNERLSLLGGSLQVESSPGSGTTLRALIPLAIATKAGES